MQEKTNEFPDFKTFMQNAPQKYKMSGGEWVEFYNKCYSLYNTYGDGKTFTDGVNVHPHFPDDFQYSKMLVIKNNKDRPDRFCLEVEYDNMLGWFVKRSEWWYYFKPHNHSEE